jgi:hypothetical protein
LTLDAAASAQAVDHAVTLLLATRSAGAAPPAAKALLATLAKLLATAHAPGAPVRAGLSVCRAGSRTAPEASAAGGRFCASVRAAGADRLDRGRTRWLSVIGKGGVRGILMILVDRLERGTTRWLSVIG